ncbi:Mannan endo-1,6-alpha-mannosidase DCW1 [Neolecta irregularis DAH-3]|uniref:Mannan endo-1,6-alpha-mannosidase n=1 Tax=Neolecta irregularis (strain DAH-3) TaxID=1198029 RepID=A0A1U7LUS0_NEOID|nr:Mannan endo-1,6-alpha-mannosidase DCW1 [Neolecta irregularis DAH-3]|eukprot:OLL26407.1 Mannan endo-1,6-alpha-mannosidase DCW1 [Neolecta irregularis DAH-3]
MCSQVLLTYAMPSCHRIMLSVSTLLLFVASCCAIEIDPSSKTSLANTAQRVGERMWEWYHGDLPGHIPGRFEGGNTHWWQVGAMFGALIDYRKYTGDTRYDESIIRGTVHQAGENWNLFPANQSTAAGNDDIVFWAFSVLSAAESNFPNPPPHQPQYIGLAKAVFHDMINLWHTETCGGGLRWQRNILHEGFKYKNSISNGGFFQIAARLARYTGDPFYAMWAEKIYDWSVKIGFVDEKNWWVYDGAPGDPDHCTNINKRLWSYNAAVYLGGAAFMYSYTRGSPIWERRVNGFVDSSLSVFFENGVIDEYTCWIATIPCNIDQVTFKGYLARFLSYTAHLVPQTADRIYPALATSAIAAGKACPEYCGFDWREGKYDGKRGVQEQLAALEVIQANMMKFQPIDLIDDQTDNQSEKSSAGGIIHGGGSIATELTGGTSRDGRAPAIEIPGFRAVTKADQFGAGFSTCIFVASVIGTLVSQ